MWDPMASKVITNMGGIVEYVSTSALGEEISHFAVLRKRHVGAFIPKGAIATMSGSVATKIGISLDNQAVCMP
jgi:hypothetical protein